MHSSLKRMWALLGVVAAIGAVAATSAIASHKAGPTIVIWTDANRAASVSKVANSWAAQNGATIQVVTKDFGSIETALGTVAAADAPDVVVAAHDWTGQLAANGLVEPLYPSKAVAAQFPQYTLDAFSYGTAVKKLYGIPVQIENIGLLVNTKLAKVPTTFAQLETEALAAKKKNAPVLRHLRPAGLGRRRVPHVPVLLRSRWLRLRHQQGREPRTRRTSASQTRRSSRTRR